MKKALTFCLLLLTWCLLVWPVGPGGGTLRIVDVLAGAVASLVALAVMRNSRPDDSLACLCPMRLVWLAAYAVVLAYYIIKANFDVAYRVLHPAMPIHPGIVKVKTDLKTRAGITALANSITLTPGTLTVNAGADGTLYVHWINVQTTDSDAAAHIIVKRFEWFVKRIFE